MVWDVEVVTMELRNFGRIWKMSTRVELTFEKEEFRQLEKNYGDILIIHGAVYACKVACEIIRTPRRNFL